MFKMGVGQYLGKFLGWIRDIWLMVGVTMLLLILGDFTIGLASPGQSSQQQSTTDLRARTPVYESFRDPADLWLEQNKATDTRFEPYYHWRRNEFKGERTNISSEGIRRTRGAESEGEDRKVFMYGGSTLWGTGAPDSMTIPSYLQNLLGDDYSVHNFGESGYVSAQELNYLLYQLSNGDIPDVVIFYDGVNDGFAGAYSPAIPRDPVGFRRVKAVQFAESDYSPTRKYLKDVFQQSNYQWFVQYLGRKLVNNPGPPDWDQLVENDIAANSESVVQMYEAHVRQVNALSKEYGFDAYFFWQPNLFSMSRKTLDYEADIIAAASPVWVESQRLVYEAAHRRLSQRETENIFFLGDIFDEVQEPIYVDWCHIGPVGNEIIAQGIFSHLPARL
jgi:lysophospholipase L1-like esterase